MIGELSWCFVLCDLVGSGAVRGEVATFDFVPLLGTPDNAGVT